MGTSITVDSHTFGTEVLQKSHEKPVLVDFFATWCGPCQMLKPMLEKLAQEYDFVLAKVDIDRNPDLANTYGVEGVPDVRVVTQGEVQDGFVGVLPEPQLRELMSKLNLKSGLEIGFEAIQVAKTAGDAEEVKRLFGELIERYPDNRPLLLEAAKFLIRQNRLDSAEKLLSSIQEYEKGYFAQAQAMRSLIQFQRECENPVIDQPLDEAYLQAARAVLAEDYETALEGFLDIVGRDRKYRNDGARKAMLTLFDLLGDDHPLTKTYRRRLMSTLY
ncbi:tetratricopeptide repeat protein [Oscillatoria sp. FACHB-1407]|uniref:tetratricopeptide repeat protein n=1 Tax=Oscillatoria sp. FACHB-1407 TaxID=2692847 RepID=UPI00168957B9|nr:tetratricopeptide repeat protein [Oscillatoria sp. FACHB-1407]MBD2463000.1 tetratricopeptide repeat protein [Oscillatoria sp. FACHB-1407]